MSTPRKRRKRASTRPRAIADHLETTHQILFELQMEAHAVRLLGKFADLATDQDADCADVLAGLNRLMTPHVREIEQQLTKLDEALIALSRTQKAA